jgi:DNA-binding transcriptional LysR family regulator
MVLSAKGGKVIFSEVERALGLLEEAENRISEMNNLATGTIRIGASDTIFEYFLADKIADFHERFPSVKIELMADFTPDTIEKLKSDKCDVAFVNLPITADSDLKLYGNCMRLNDIFIAGEKYSSLAEKPISLSALKKYPLILMDENTIARRSLNNFLSSVGVSLTPSIEVGSWDLMKRLVSKGMGIGVIPREYAMRRLNEKSLYEVKTEVSLPVRSVGILLKKNATISYALHCFIDLFIQTDKGL